MLEVHELNSVEQLARYAADWQTLLAQTRQAYFFQSLDWLTGYWKHVGAGQKLRVLVVCERGSPIGIVPLVVRREPTKAGTLRFLTYPLDCWGSFYGPIGPRPREALTAALTHVRRTKCDWDVIELRWVHPDDVAQGDSAAALETCRLPSQFAISDKVSVIRLEGDFDAYFAARPSKWRNNYRRWERRLSERGAVRYVRCRPAGEARGDVDAMDEVFTLPPDSTPGYGGLRAQELLCDWLRASRDGGTPCRNTPESTVAVLELLDAIYQSSREGHRVECRIGGP